MKEIKIDKNSNIEDVKTFIAQIPEGTFIKIMNSSSIRVVYDDERNEVLFLPY